MRKFEAKKKVRSVGGYDLWLATTDLTDDQAELMAVVKEGTEPDDSNFEFFNSFNGWNSLTGDEIDSQDLAFWWERR